MSVEDDRDPPARRDAAALLRTLGVRDDEDALPALVRAVARRLDVARVVVRTLDDGGLTLRVAASYGVEGDAAPTPRQGSAADAILRDGVLATPDGLGRLGYVDVAPDAAAGLGVPVTDLRAGDLGVLLATDPRPRAFGREDVADLRLFAAVVAGEVARRRLAASLRASEERFRDLFDEAPIAYVHEGLDSRFIRANRAALRTLGISAEDVPTTYGRTFVPETPDAQRRLREAFESIGRGVDTSGVILELRRKDDGRPIWIQWWSKPDLSGEFTRTMFVDVTERVLLERDRARLKAENRYLVEEIRSSHHFGEIVGRDPALLKVLERLARVAPTDSTVLIQGETGTGKELLARALHDKSRRRDAPFVKVNCAALPAGLVESEFFGHEKGSFTGAVGARRGRFELADGGTIFLDEVGEVAPDVQAKLLRVLQENAFERVGGSETVRVDVRVVAATNRDLAAEVAAGRFRADLYYRLNVFPIQSPPLRARPADLPLLAKYFVTQIAANVGKRIDGIEAGTMARLAAYPWPGNIRELRNVLERAVILAEGPELRLEEELLPEPGRGPRPTAAAPTSPATSSAPRFDAGAVRSLADAEREHIREALRRTGGVVAGPAGAAKLLGVPPGTLRSLMTRLGVSAK